MENPTVTVLVPVYRNADTIRDCLESIMSQTYPNLQIVICDDCSPDNSMEVIGSFLSSNGHRKSGNHILTRNATNLGMHDNVNRLLSLPPTEKYTMVIEGDDILYSTKIEKQVKFLEENPNFGAVHADADFLYPDGTMQIKHWATVGRYDNFGNHSEDIPTGHIFDELVKNNFIMTCSFMAHNELWELMDCKLFKERKYKMLDYPFYLRVADVTEIGYIDESLSIYRISPTSASNDPSKRAEFVASTLQIQEDARMGRL